VVIVSGPLPSHLVTRPTTKVDILVVRHGESEWNAAGRWQGHADPPLTALGREQARVAARVLELVAMEGVVSIASSDLDRARTTAAIFSDVLGLPDPVVDPRLRETDAGEWQGCTHAEIERDWPGYLDAGRRPPGFESMTSTADRAHAALNDLAATLGLGGAGAHRAGAVVVVSHSGTIRALRERCGAPARRLPNLAGAWFSVVAPGSSPHTGPDLISGGELHLLEHETLSATD
jgi:broad specificity phosphatase PhoE